MVMYLWSLMNSYLFMHEVMMNYYINLWGIMHEFLYPCYKVFSCYLIIILFSILSQSLSIIILKNGILYFLAANGALLKHQVLDNIFATLATCIKKGNDLAKKMGFICSTVTHSTSNRNMTIL